MALSLLALVLAAFVLLVFAGAAVLALVLVFRRSGRRGYDPDDAPSPLERVQAAASALTPAEWEEFLRWVDGRRALPPRGGEGITQ